MGIHPRTMQFYGIHNINKLPQLKHISDEELFSLKVVANVLPFRTNNYVADELIDWTNVPNDPLYRLTFMHKDMLTPEQYELMAQALRRKAPSKEIAALAHTIRMQLNPHPSGQMTDNVPFLDGDSVPGVQHKYRETCLIFPSNGQTCHAYCTYCFRWPQFVGQKDLKFATDESMRFMRYLKQHREITDVLVTGGDPMIMTAENLRFYMEPLLEPELEHIRTIRIGTKSLAYWPYRFVTDRDADDVLRLFEKVVASGKHLAIMGHFNHWREIATEISQRALSRVRSTGAVIRTQSPIVRHVNDTPEVWKRLWEDQVKLGCIPYYMFIARDTGANDYFAVPLYQAHQIFTEAYTRVSGLGRTVRGPSMSAHPGKVAIEGIAEVHGEKVFVLTLLQARDPQWCRRPFFAKFDPQATWLDDLQPAFGADRFFYEEDLAGEKIWLDSLLQYTHPTSAYIPTK